MEGYITTTEAAERLGISSARVRQLVASGKLPAQKFGPVNMVREADLDLIRERPSAGRPPQAKADSAKSGTVESQTRTTRRLDSSIKRAADRQMVGKKKGGRK